jgi:hypothetical protein
MLRYVSIATILLLFIFNVIHFNEIKKNNEIRNDLIKSYERLAEIHNDLITVTSKSFLYEDWMLPKNLFVHTEKNDSISICDIFENQSKLIICYIQGGCEPCVDNNIEMVKKVFEKKNENVVVLTQYEHPQDIIIFRRKHQLKSPVYTIRDMGINLEGNDIYFFVSDNSCLVKSFFVPTPLCPELTEHYLSIIAEKYFDVHETNM